MFLCVFVCPYQNRNIFEYQNNQCKQCERRKEYVKYPYISCGCTHEIHTTEASSCSYQPKANCVKLDDDWNRVETRWKNGHDNDKPKNVNTYTDEEMYQSAQQQHDTVYWTKNTHGKSRSQCKRIDKPATLHTTYYTLKISNQQIALHVKSFNFSSSLLSSSGCLCLYSERICVQSIPLSAFETNTQYTFHVHFNTVPNFR